MALATVAAISMILFILATTMVMLASQQQVSASNQVQRTKALSGADAGISAYLYDLSRNQNYANQVPDISGSTADASWTVHATPAGPGSAVTVLTAVGTIKAQGSNPAVTRTIKVQVKPGSFSDYMMMFNDYLNLGTGGVVRGNVRSNSYVNNDGEITGNTYAASYISGGGVFDKGTFPYYGAQSFAVVNYGSLLATATSDGTYWPDAGTFGTAGVNKRHYVGYNLVLSGNGGTVTKITSVSTTTGVLGLDTTSTVSFTTPANGVLYFDDAVWISGTYGAKLTIVAGKSYEDPGTDSTYGRMAPGMGSSASQPGTNPTSTAGPWANKVNSSVFLWKNLQSANAANSDIVCGIVSRGDISITSEYPDAVTPTSLTIQAALLSSAGSIHADWTTGHVKNYLKLFGAEAMFDAGFIKQTNGYGTTTMGFNTRDYWYDPNLDVTSPPNFPTLDNGSLNVQTWTEN